MKKLFVILISLLMLCSCAETGTTQENPETNIYNVNYGKDVPELYVGVESWGNSDPAAKGGYEWNKDNGDGTMSNTIACGIHPLEMQNIPNFLTSGKEKINLVFDETMVSYDVIRYEVEPNRWENGGYTGNEVSETVETENGSFVIAGNGKDYVYVVNVNYENGRCEYVFGITAGEIVIERYKIVDGAETGKLVLASENDGDVMTLNAKNIPVFLDGKPADASALMDGMTAEIHHSGMILESYPAMFGEVDSIHVYSIGTKNQVGGTMFDLCGLYLKVLDDLWNVDSGLNGGAEMVSIDLSEAPGGLTESEKAAIAWVFGNKHGVMAFNFTMEELKENGYLTAAGGSNNLYQWDNGVLLSITEAKSEEPNAYFGLTTIEFNAMKWRSPLGAYMFMDCTASWPQMGTWEDYNIGSQAIS